MHWGGANMRAAAGSDDAFPLCNYEKSFFFFCPGVMSKTAAG